MIKAMQKSKTPKGGARVGAGAPRKERTLKNYTIRVYDDQVETLKNAGGSKFVRGLLDLLSDCSK